MKAVEDVKNNQQDFKQPAFIRPLVIQLNKKEPAFAKKEAITVDQLVKFLADERERENQTGDFAS